VLLAKAQLGRFRVAQSRLRVEATICTPPAAAAVSLTTAEEGKAEEQLLAKLEEKVLKLKETMSSVLAAQSLELEKLANVAEFVTRSDSKRMG